MKPSVKLALVFGLVAVAAAIAYFVFFKKSAAATVAAPSGLGADDDALFQQSLSIIKQYTPPGDVDWIIDDFGKHMSGDLTFGDPDDSMINGVRSKGMTLLKTYFAEFWGPGYHGDNGGAGTVANYNYINGGTNKIVGDKLWALYAAYKTKITIAKYG